MLDYLKKLYKFAGKHRKIFVWTIISGALKSVFNMVQIIGVYFAVVGVVNGITSQTILSVTMILLAFLAGKFFCALHHDFYKSMTGLRMCTDKRIELGNRLRFAPMGYFSENNVGKISSAVTTDMYMVEMMGVFGICNLVNGFLDAVILMVFTLCFDWRIGLIVLATIILYECAFALMQNHGKKKFPEVVNIQSKLASSFLEYIRGIAVVRAFNAQSVANERIKKSIHDSHVKHIKLELGFMPSAFLMYLVLYIGSAALMVCSAIFYLQGTLELAAAITLVAISFMIFSELEVSATTTPIIRAVSAAMDRVDKVFDMPRQDDGGKQIELKDRNICLNEITFAYDRKDVIKNVSLQIPEGNRVAFVGTSGGGKSTLCKLIARFWDVDQGSITMGGHNLKEFEFDSLMSNITMVFQNVYLFRDTIANNIRFGKPHATDEEVIAAAKAAHCHDFITSLDDGYETLIGEGGASLSGGEKQRISIARAMLKDAPVVILDEATASVDPENEKDTMAAIAQLTEGKTVITIAHKLSTIKTADDIYVIEDGKIAEHGNHELLSKLNGKYAEFLRIRESAEGWRL